MRPKNEIEARINLVAQASDRSITMAFDEAIDATKRMSPSSAFSLAFSIAKQTLDSSQSTAVAKAVRWQRVLERDYLSR